MKLVRRLTGCVFLLFCVAFQAVASGSNEEAGAPPEFSGRYAALEDDANDLFAGLETSGAPVEKLMLLYKEGISKSVLPDTLQEAARREYDRLRFAAELFSEYYPHEEHPREAFEALVLGMQSGIATELVESMAPAADTPTRLGDLIAALGRIRRWDVINADTLGQLGNALLESELNRQAYKAVATILVRAMAQGEPAEIIDRVVRILQNGGGLVQISREIDSRRTP